MRFYTTEQLGPKRSLTPEGFLLCEDVPVARTGIQIYHRGEVPIEPGPDGVIRVERNPDEVFRPETLASGNGKYCTIDHPPVDVTPENCRELGRGHAMNFRRGIGAFDDVMLADLLVSCPEAIEGIKRHELNEISLGYDADYEEVAPGHGRQSKIVINHVAFLEPGGSRCGPRCSIGDHAATCAYATCDAEFKENEHPRAESGKFAAAAEYHKNMATKHYLHRTNHSATSGIARAHKNAQQAHEWAQALNRQVASGKPEYSSEGHKTSAVLHSQKANKLSEKTSPPLVPKQSATDSSGTFLSGELDDPDRAKHAPLSSVRTHARTRDLPPSVVRRRPLHVHIYR